MQLNYKTRGKDVSPQGKARVYFCCHPDDFSTYFEDISLDVLKAENCAIFYDEKPTEISDKAEWESRLKDMQLFVMPVTSKLLTTQNKGLEEYRLAVKNHVPVLPLMQEKGLDILFNSVCGNLQYLDKHQVDETAISFDEKLKTFVQNVLIGDEEATEIRSAFRAYIFLSYRKKDRAHAQRLMRLVHKSPLCRDVAIWYDEYLVPGEDFNNAIGDALAKSHLFLLAVTPNLVCEPNYVQAVEYPMAVKASKVILPVEMASTNGKMLTNQYADIPTVITENDEARLMDALADIFPMTDTKNDLQHDYLIALAYLDGVDVEVDHARAIQMLTDCANAGHVEATRKMVYVYKTGKGVERDTSKALEWQLKLVQLLKLQTADNQWTAQADYSTELLLLGEFYEQLRKYEKALEVYQELEDFCKVWVQKSNKDDYAMRIYLRAYSYKGQAYANMYDYDNARANYVMALAIAEEQADKLQSVDSYYDVTFCYCDLGRCYEKLADYKNAILYYENRRELLDAILQMESDNHDLHTGSLLQCYMDLFDVYADVDDISQATDCMEKLLPLATSIAEEKDDYDSKESLMFAYNRMANLGMLQGDLEKQKEWLNKSLELNIQLTDENDSIDARQNLANVLEALAGNAQTAAQYDEADDYLQKVLFLRESISSEVQIDQTRYQLALTYTVVGGFYDDIYDVEKALEYLHKSQDLLLGLIAKNPTADFRSALTDVYWRLGNIAEEGSDEARVYYEKGLQICLDLYDELKEEKFLDESSNFYFILATWYTGKDNKKALDYHQKSLQIGLNYAEKHDTVEDWRSCLTRYRTIGDFYWEQFDDGKKALEYYYKSLEIAENLLKRSDSRKIRSAYAVTLDVLASYYQKTEDYLKAIEFFQKELAVHTRIANETQSIVSHGSLYAVHYNLSELYILTDNFEKAKEHEIGAVNAMIEYKKLDYNADTGVNVDETIYATYLAIAKTCSALDQAEECIKYNLLASQYAGQLVEDEVISREEYADVLRKLAELYKEQNDAEKSVEYFILTLEQSNIYARDTEQPNDLFVCGEDCVALADMYYLFEEYDDAVAILAEAKELFEECIECCKDYQPEDELDEDGNIDISAFLDDDQDDEDDEFIPHEDVKAFYVECLRKLSKVCYKMGLCHFFNRQKEDAVECYYDASAWGATLVDLTDDTDDWYDLALTCFMTGKIVGKDSTEQAEKICQMLVDEDPNNGKYKGLLARIKQDLA